MLSNMERQDVPHRKATIGHDGTYSVTTLQGRNVARISGPMVKKEPQLGYALVPSRSSQEIIPGTSTFRPSDG